MKILHTGDLHIGASKILGEGYLERQIEAVDAIMNLALDRNIETVVIAGDIFDNESPDAHEHEAFLQRMIAYDQMGLRILAICGNHDQGHAGRRTAIRTLAQLTDQGVFKKSVFTETTKYVRVEDTIFTLLVHRPRFFHEDCGEAISKLKSGSVVVDHKHLVMVIHETIKGSVTDTNWRLTSGVNVPELAIGETIPEHNVTAWMAGDIHIMQRLGPRAYYSGAPLQVKFGDAPHKGVLIWDTENPENPEFVEIQSKKLLKVIAHGGMLPEIPQDVYVKFVATSDVITQARSEGHDITKFEVVKQDAILNYQANLDLAGKVFAGIDQLLQDADENALGKREAAALFTAAGVS